MEQLEQLVEPFVGILAAGLIEMLAEPLGDNLAVELFVAFVERLVGIPVAYSSADTQAASLVVHSAGIELDMQADHRQTALLDAHLQSQ